MMRALAKTGLSMELTNVDDNIEQAMMLKYCKQKAFREDSGLDSTRFRIDNRDSAAAVWWTARRREQQQGLQYDACIRLQHTDVPLTERDILELYQRNPQDAMKTFKKRIEYEHLRTLAVYQQAYPHPYEGPRQKSEEELLWQKLEARGKKAEEPLELDEYWLGANPYYLAHLLSKELVEREMAKPGDYTWNRQLYPIDWMEMEFTKMAARQLAQVKARELAEEKEKELAEEKKKQLAEQKEKDLAEQKEKELAEQKKNQLTQVAVEDAQGF